MEEIWGQDGFQFFQNVADGHVQPSEDLQPSKTSTWQHSIFAYNV